MNAEIQRNVTSRIDPGQLRDMTFELVSIPSPTGNSKAAAKFYADYLRELGLEVEITEPIPGGPNITGRLRGSGGGPALSLVGHLDTVHSAHEPPRKDAEAVYGRGADDMKGSMVAVAEAIRAIKASGIHPRGDIIIAAHSMHEAPVGHMEGLRAFLKDRALGDAAIVAESVPPDTLIVIGKGQVIFDIQITRDGPVVHENYAQPGTPHPILIGVEICNRLVERNRELSATELPYVGPETVFIGEFSSGDFYNRLPNTCHIQGIRRFGPGKTEAEISQEFEQILAPVRRNTPATITLKLTSNGTGYQVAQDAPVVQAIAQAHRTITGRDMPVGGSKSVTDANIIAGEGGIPAIAYGPNGTTGHSSNEYVRIADLERAAKVFALAALDYAGFDE